MPGDPLILDARAFAAAFAEHSVVSIEIVRGDERTILCARETDLPTMLVELCAHGGSVIADGVQLRAHAGGFELIEAADSFRATVASAKAMLESAIDPSA